MSLYLGDPDLSRLLDDFVNFSTTEASTTPTTISVADSLRASGMA
jgi:hypothetical protein